jgi:protein TonB
MKKPILILLLIVASFTVKAQSKPDSSKSLNGEDELLRAQPKAIEPPSDQTPYNQGFVTVVNEPKFPQGGAFGFSRYIQKHLNDTKHSDFGQGKVVINFIVEKDGNLSNVKATNSFNDEAASIAVAIVKKSPKWVSATQNQQPISMGVSVTVDFGMNN